MGDSARARSGRCFPRRLRGGRAADVFGRGLGNAPVSVRFVDVRQEASQVNPSPLSGGSAVLVLFALAAGISACRATWDLMYNPREESVYNPREEVIDALFGAAERGDKNAQCRLVTLYAEGQLDVAHRADPYAEAELAEALGPDRDNSRIGGRMPSGTANNPDAPTVIGHLVAARTSETREERERLRNLGIWSFRCLAEAEAELRAEIRASIDRATMNGVRALATRGRPEAQLLLGMAFALGVGVFENPVLAHMWFSVAAANGNAAAAPSREAVEAGMTPEQIDRASGLARRCLDSDYLEC